jgi:hypothetical protein
MMRRYVAGAAGLAAAALLLFLPSRGALEVVLTKTGQEMLCAEMDEGEEVVLSFTHSANRRPVFDTLRVDGNQLVIVKSRFDSFGAGMPETSTSEGTLHLSSDGWLEWTVNRPVPEVSLFVGRVANHVLHVRGREIALADLAEPGTSVTLLAVKISRYAAWKGRCIR